MSLQNFEILNKLGEGAFSSVFKARRISDGLFYAIKKIHIQNLSKKQKKNALREIQIMASLTHPNIISYKEAFFDEDSQCLFLIMEYADSGDLLQRIQSCTKRKTKFTEKTIWAIFIQITKGLKSLHDLDVLHRDIKSANVFMNKDGSVKLGDLNISKVTKDGFLKTQTGTPFYASPEVWKDQKYNKKSDIWSLGCVLYEICTLKPPFNGRDFNDLYGNIVSGRLDPIPRQYSKDLANVIRFLLKTNPTDRPNCHEILEMEAVLKNCEDFNPKTRSYNLLDPIKLPKEMTLLSSSLPRPCYAENISTSYNLTYRNYSKNLENSGDYKNSVYENKNTNGQLKLPTLKSQQQLITRNKLIHKYIENSNDTIKKLQNLCTNPNQSLFSIPLKTSTTHKKSFH